MLALRRLRGGADAYDRCLIWLVAEQFEAGRAAALTGGGDAAIRTLRAENEALRDRLAGAEPRGLETGETRSGALPTLPTEALADVVAGLSPADRAAFFTSESHRAAVLAWLDGLDADQRRGWISRLDAGAPTTDAATPLSPKAPSAPRPPSIGRAPSAPGFVSDGAAADPATRFEMVRTERDLAAAERDTLRSERDTLSREFTAAAEERDQLRAERRDWIEERRRLARALHRLSEEHAEAANEVERLRAALGERAN